MKQSHSIEVRLKEASKRYGEIFHFVVSVPTKVQKLELEALREKVREVLLKRGCVWWSNGVASCSLSRG